LKTVTVIGDNPKHGRPTVQANYLLFSAETGETLAIMDGTEITLRRTASAAALAADYLARQDSSTLLMVGAGTLAPHVVRAHAVLRPISRVLVWNRSMNKAGELVAALNGGGIEASLPQSLEAACASADIVACATTSNTAVIRGAWLSPGVHVDLMGAFTADMRETDGEAIARSRVYVDTLEGAEREAGDLLQAEREGSFRMTDIVADLARLCRGEAAGRGGADEITLFKSCGTAIEDLATAIMIYEKARV
jgi:ornithine cyclodeaminase